MGGCDGSSVSNIKLTALASCTGCAAKLSAKLLAKSLDSLPKFSHPNLLVGTETFDDAAVYKLDEETALVQTVDFFPPIVDDPYAYGQISAANSLSDVYAMGGTPLLALTIAEFPASLDIEIFSSIMRGGADKAKEAGVLIVGGHTIRDSVPKYGLAVTGLINPKKIFTNSNAKVGDSLILTKPLGSGVIATAAKEGAASRLVVFLAQRVMSSLNKSASEAMVRVGANSCTDVTGFGLAGHASRMAKESGVGFVIYASKLPLMKGAAELSKAGFASGGLKNNREVFSENVEMGGEVPDEIRRVIFDPQTSGGLLISTPKPVEMVEEMKKSGADARIIGEAVNEPKGRLVVKW